MVKDENRDEFLKNIQTDLPPATSMMVSTLENLKRPVLLDERIFWLRKQLELPANAEVDLALKLLSFKYGFDKNEGGFDNMRGQENMISHTTELRPLLWDIFTFRGNRMMDIAIYRNPITVSIRYSDHRVESSEELTKIYIKEFEKTFKEMEQLIADNYSPTTDN